MGVAAFLILLFTVINCDTRTEDIREEPGASVYGSRFVAALPFPGRGDDIRNEPLRILCFVEIYNRKKRRVL